MAELSVGTISRSGLTPALVAVSSADTFKNPATERTLLYVKNDGGVSVTVTVPVQTQPSLLGDFGSGTLSDVSVAIPAGEERMIGPFAAAFTDEDGFAHAQFSATASVTAQPLKLPADTF